MYGAIRHKTRGRKRAGFARRTGGKWKNLKVGIAIYRSAGVKSIRYHAQACFYPGGIAGIEPGDPRTAKGRQVYLHKRRVRLQENRCARGEGAGPTQAVKRALAALAKKPL